MSVHPLAGKPATPEMLANIPRLMTAYYALHPQEEKPDQRVEFGTSGHRGSSLEKSFNEDHILAVSQAICDYRATKGITGPLFLGMDTHALSEAAFVTALEVFAANGLHVFYQKDRRYTPTPVISHAVLTYNRDKKSQAADGVVITPSHNPPEDGGFKYNPPHGGPAEAGVTRIIEDRANEYLSTRLKGIKRIPFDKALGADSVHGYDYIPPYVADLKNVVNMDAVARAGLSIGVDPMGGSGLDFWEPIAEVYGLNIDVVNRTIDPAFAFMKVDKDGKIRMDCSSKYAMAGLIEHREKYDIAFGNDPDYDRHGIVTRESGLLNPNHFLSVAVSYLFANRPNWRPDTAIGKTLVSSSMIDRIAGKMNIPLVEVPVGFKWFVAGLLHGDFGFGGEESAGASFLRMDGTAWTTDKDGFIMDLLAAEITAVEEKDPAELYRELEGEFGSPIYERMDAPATPEQKNALKNLSPGMVDTDSLGGEKIVRILTKAPGNDAPIGGLKVVTDNGWFAARPSGTEDIYKIYAESFRGRDHLQTIQEEAKAIVQKAFSRNDAV